MAELKELAEFYARAAAMKDPVIKCHGRIARYSPCDNSDMKEWTVEERQPDFQCLIDSGIDCEFSDNGDSWVIGKLSEVMTDKALPYSNGSTVFKYCQPRLNHVHAWIATEDSKCPVPESYRLRVYLINGNILVIDSGLNGNSGWSIASSNRIVAFEVLPK